MARRASTMLSACSDFDQNTTKSHSQRCCVFESETECSFSGFELGRVAAERSTDFGKWGASWAGTSAAINFHSFTPRLLLAHHLSGDSLSVIQ